jgi:hypothetical protein
MSLVPLFGAMGYAHPYIPRKPLEAEERSMRRQPRDGHRAFPPARMQVVIPDVRDIAVEALHRLPLPFRLPSELAGCREPLVEKHFVERGMLQGFCVNGLDRRQRDSAHERQSRGGEATLQDAASTDHVFPPAAPDVGRVRQSQVGGGKRQGCGNRLTGSWHVLPAAIAAP